MTIYDTEEDFKEDFIPIEAWCRTCGHKMDSLTEAQSHILNHFILLKEWVQMSATPIPSDVGEITDTTPPFLGCEEVDCDFTTNSVSAMLKHLDDQVRLDEASEYGINTHTPERLGDHLDPKLPLAFRRGGRITIAQIRKWVLLSRPLAFCKKGGEVIYYLPDVKSREPGHVYDSTGFDVAIEFNLCQYHCDPKRGIGPGSTKE